jgi:U6 snRNA-associated Sm-like protein LSm6
MDASSHPSTTRIYPSSVPLSNSLTTPVITMDSPSPKPEESSGPAAGSPSDFLKNIVGKKVRVRIGTGVDYHGEHVSSRKSDHRLGEDGQ